MLVPRLLLQIFMTGLHQETDASASFPYEHCVEDPTGSDQLITMDDCSTTKSDDNCDDSEGSGSIGFVLRYRSHVPGDAHRSPAHSRKRPGWGNRGTISNSAMGIRPAYRESGVRAIRLVQITGCCRRCRSTDGDGA